MAYILTNKKTDDYLVRVDFRGDIVFLPTTDIETATPYETYNDMLGGIRDAGWYSDINAGSQIYNGPHKTKDNKS